MLDIKFIIENKDVVKEDLKKRNEEELIPKLDEMINYYEKFKEIKASLDELRHKRNILKEEAQKRRKSGEDIQNIILEIKEISNKIKEMEEKEKDMQRKYLEILYLIPNITHDSVPYGKDESDNVVVREVGEKKKFSFEPRDHIEIMEKRKWFDLERAAKVSGARFYYLKGNILRLEMALIAYAYEFLTSKGFTFMSVPMLAREFAFFGTGYLPKGKDDLYKIEGEDYYLIGTAEVALGAYHANEVLMEKDLPLRYAGISSCFRTEAGSHGRDTKGIFRVHQFEKVEMFSFAHPEHSWEEHEFLISTAEEFYKSLDIPYRVVNVCSGDLGPVAAKKYDIEAYLPGQGKYREIVSCSNTTDYQARRLNIKYRAKEGEKPKGYVHTLNSTLTAIQRTIIAIVENYQREDYTVEVPKVLQKYVGEKIL